MQIEKSELDKQIDKLLERERTCRTLNDHLGSTAVLKEITTLCYKTGDIDKTCEVVINLMKKRGQAKKAQIQLVQMIMGWLPEIKDHDKKMKVVETIREVCDKKIFLQVEYARAVLMIVQNKEDANNINDAAKILQEVQVQTYGSMSRREKLEFILYQMKIMIKRGDYVRLFIISKKINEANLNDDELIDLKVRFYAYMCIYYNHENKYGDTARCYKTIWKALKDTKVEDNPCTTDFDFSIRYSDVLANYVGFLVLEPFSQSQKSQLEELFKSEQIESTPHVYHMVSTFLSREIVSCEPTTYNLQRYTLFDKAYENSEKHLHSFRKMLIQHNIRTMAEYYERLKLPRMAQLTSVPVQDVEQQLCDLMNNKLVTCHIDRLEQTVDFKPPQNENTVLSKWNESINSILELIDKASNLIERENEIHLIKA